MTTAEVRVRVAPSPTGDPHVGLGYIMLFNTVFAKKHGGKIVLRIEDTDQKRSRESSEQAIFDSLRWLGLHWDEGPDVGGPFGPYRQSERSHIHREHADQLVAKGAAYACFCTEERLNEVRQTQKAAGKTTSYDRHCRELPSAEVVRLKEAATPYVIRLKMPLHGASNFIDELRGEIHFEYEQMDDQVLIKSDGFPTYHLANVVDDHLMQISHVMRAEEWINSTPKHMVLYSAFGWNPPKFIHMPLLRNADKSKISKRKNPVSLTYYRRKGILPEAMVNFLALMGWSYSADQEIFTMQQMIERWELKQIHLGGPVFDMKKLVWLNGHYMHRMDEDAFVAHMRNEIFSAAYLKKLKPLVLERMETFDQFADKNAFFFNGGLNLDIAHLVPKGREKADLKAAFSSLVELLDELYTWNALAIKALLDQHLAGLGWKPKEYFMPLRLATTGRADSPPLVETLEVLGRDIVRARLRDAIGILS